MASLLTPEELHATRDAVVLDVRRSLGGPPGRGLYDASHVPGARFCDLEQDLSGRPGPGGEGGRHPLPSAETFEAAMRRLGVTEGSPVVVYDQDGGYGAARAWWCLRYFGHPSVWFLDGGFRAWTEAGFPVTADRPEVAPGDFTARPGGMPTLDAAAAAALARDGVLLDARAASRYRGEDETVDPVAGHIPGAISAPTTENVAPGKGFRPPEILRSRFADLGVDDGVAVGVYCGSGVSAAHEILALEVAGVPAALYVGSWSDWISDRSRPVATGAGPGRLVDGSPVDGSPVDGSTDPDARG